MSVRRSDSQRFAEILSYALLAALAVAVPIVLWSLDPPFVSRSYLKSYQPFELFGFSATLALLAAVALRFRKLKGGSIETWLPTLAAVLVSLHFLGLVTEYSRQSWDYGCYQDAASALLHGRNPYGQGYLYPPLMIQVMAWLHQSIQLAVSALPFPVRHDDVAVWYLIFYLHQCAQFLLVVGAFALSLAFARNAGLEPVTAALVVSAVLVFDNPLLRTLRHNQVNLWILDLSLLAIVASRRSPLLSGLAAALGGHLKLYPLALVAPWALVRNRRAIAATLLGLMVILLIQTRGARDWELWSQFVASSRSFPEVAMFRDNSLRGIVFNSLRLGAGGAGTIPAALEPILTAVVGLAVAGVIGWLAARALRREKLHASSPEVAAGASRGGRDTLRLYGHSTDALALVLIAAPVAWEHHYVLAIPVALWAIATRWRDAPWKVGAASTLMLALPTFDVFPLSYVRIAGLLSLVALTSPDAVWRAARLGADAGG